MSSTPIRVDDLLRQRKSSQRHLARVLGVSQSAVARRLKGTVEFRLSELETIATHFDVKVSDLLAE